VRRLIINADDLGLTRGVNRAIAEAHDNGIVGSATLMAVSPAFEDALSVATHRPQLGVGCHTVLLDGDPLTPAASLRRRNGELHRSVSSFARALMMRRILAEEITAEAVAQMRKIQAAGVSLTHFDTHKHTHMFPEVLRALLIAARECGVRAVRNPFVPFGILKARPLLRRALWMRTIQTRVLYTYAEGFDRAVKDAGMKTTLGSFGVVATGSLDQAMFLEILDAVPDGTWEFVCHPGYNDPDLAKARTRLLESRQTELAILTSAESKRRVRERGIELISYADL